MTENLLSKAIVWSLLFWGVRYECVGAEATRADTTATGNVTCCGVSEGCQADSSVRSVTIRDGVSQLRKIEGKAAPPVLQPGPPQQSSLPAYYWAENRELLARFESAKQAFHQSSSAMYHAVTLVSGAAGVGKTFLKGKVFDKNYPRESTCKFDIGELFDRWTSEGRTFAKPDLTFNNIVVNRLKSIKDKSEPLLRDYLEAQDASFYVIDSLDEIHSDDCAWALEQIEDFVFHRQHRFVHVVVFGRGSAFFDFWSRRTKHRQSTDIKLFVLNPPSFRTTGDLLLSSWNYHTWAFGLAWAPDGGKSSGMSLEDYAEWIKTGCSHSGRYASVTSKGNDPILAKVHETLVQYSAQHPFVRSTLYNLAGNGLIRKIVQHRLLSGQPYDENQIKRAYLDGWLVRETKTDGLPSPDNPKYLDLYLLLLGKVAAKSIEENSVDTDGFFPVADDDVVHVTYAGHQGAVPVKQILDHSGLTFMDPRLSGTAKYRFEPVWFHRLLVEMFNDRERGSDRLALEGVAR